MVIVEQPLLNWPAARGLPLRSASSDRSIRRACRRSGGVVFGSLTCSRRPLMISRSQRAFSLALTAGPPGAAAFEAGEAEREGSRLRRECPVGRGGALSTSRGNLLGQSAALRDERA